jgi:hypothetical protein
VKHPGIAAVLGCLALIVVVIGVTLSTEAAFALVFGWISFLGRAMQRVRVDLPAVALGAVALVLFTVGVHWVGRAWRRASLGHVSGAGWRWRWSATVVATVFLLFAAGICLVGLVHQISWLATDPEPLLFDSVRILQPSQTPLNLRFVTCGLHNYHDGYLSFPSGGTFTPTGAMLHSWETYILPYFPYDSTPIDRELPWNHPRNEKYFRCAPGAFLDAAFVPDHILDQEGFGLSHYAANSWVLGANTRTKREDITDGLATTILLGQVNADFKPWGHPVNWRDPARGINKGPDTFGGAPGSGGAYFAMADASCRFLSEHISPQVLRALATPNGGETIDPTALGPRE